MRVKMKWQVRVEATQKIDDLAEFSSDVKRGLVDSEMVPADCWIESANYDYSRMAEVVVRWDTVSEMDAGIHEPEDVA